MQLTLTQIMSLVTTLNQGRTDYSTSELSLWANLALSELCQRVEMQSLDSWTYSSTTSGDSSVTFPTDANYITSVSNVSVLPGARQRTLTPTSPEDVDSGQTTVAMPTHYAVVRNQILLWPSADSAYSLLIRFQERVPVLVTSTATAQIDVQYNDALMYRTAAIAAAMRNDLDGEAAHQARYLGIVGSAPSARGLKMQGRPRLAVKWT